MPSNFVILFHGKEGTTPIVSLLDSFREISMLRTEDPFGFEPFDHYQAGPIGPQALVHCVEMALAGGPFDADRINDVYSRTAPLPIRSPSPGSSVVGFKMRLREPTGGHPLVSRLRGVPLLGRAVGRVTKELFDRQMVRVFDRANATTFVSVRQDILRWALSKYHGDGTGRQGHLQFKVAQGTISTADVRPIQVDIDRLAEVVQWCEDAHDAKSRLLVRLRRRGVRAFPLLYEDFVDDQVAFFSQMFQRLELAPSEDVELVLRAEIPFRRVHQHDISQFVLNHEEVLHAFGDRYRSWHSQN